jgi:hypothetical protein
MAISKPGGRFGPPSTDTPGKEKKARSDRGYQDGVQVGFGLTGGSLDPVPVSPKSPVHVGKEGMPDTNMTNGNVNTESR